MKKTEQMKLVSTIPNFRPVEFDGTRLDIAKEHSIVFDSSRERDKAYSLLRKEGIKCQKS